MAPSFFHTSSYVIIFTITSINYIFPAFSFSSISYNDHCSSIIPESQPTNSAYLNFLPNLRTSYLTGGDQLLGRKQPKQTYYFAGRSIWLRIARNCYETTAKGVYKVDASLSIWPPYQFYPSYGGNYSYGGSYYGKGGFRERATFSLNGFWSEISRKMCLVGSASSQAEGGKTLNHDAVLKLNYASENPNMNTSVVNWILESLSSVNDAAYFDPISVFSFPILSNYNYSLVSEEVGKGLLKEFIVPKNQSLSLEKTNFCSLLSGRWIVLELDYGVKCEHCSLFDGRDGFLPRFLSLSPIQCSPEERKLRYIVAFQNISYVVLSFDLDSTFIGEASWDDKNNELYVVTCRILNSSSHFGSGVGDCSMRLSLRFPSVWTISNDAMIVGELWSAKSVEEIGYFRRINLTSTDGSNSVAVPGRIYEYTVTGRVRKACSVKKTVKKGNVYPDGNSYAMRFNMFVKNSKGEQFAGGHATPISVGNELYERRDVVVAVDSMAPESAVGFATFNEAEVSTKTVPLNISYRIRINPFVSTLNSSMNLQRQMDITAEGVILRFCPMETSLTLHLVKFDFVPLNEKRGGFIKGTITSTRAKSDLLYFDDLSLLSAAFYPTEAKRSIWRMDLEITMVLISNTLLCIFIGIQLFHVKRNPEVFSCISLVMLVVLSLGDLIPLVVNFEAMFFENHIKQTVVLSNGRWLEGNEVTVRVITMVAFLLQIRLLQLVWTAKQSEGNDRSLSGEKKTAFVSLPLYILGGLITLLINRTRNKTTMLYGFYQKRSLWVDLRSYAGLILDGFLLPQILSNTFTGSRQKALSHPFYIGTSSIRLVPHAYDQYRLRNYPMFESNTTYYYANPTADFYSTAWDVVIPFGVIVLAVMVFLQQRHGGRWILPRRFREVELYEKVPVVDNE
ncbi:hypothetical protein CDL12_04555 [Handroanthus impetiginosus]|uniref:RING-type E3 ubiquitin transferase n=1 Tax=Handroanthus impetiginosus TaxID=429701 RepID=A0A2G9HZ05_9LAMI|nr:hypothetical protein CDL12_04555 [Handroanthus impetiginosus]